MRFPFFTYNGLLRFFYGSPIPIDQANCFIFDCSVRIVPAVLYGRDTPAARVVYVGVNTSAMFGDVVFRGFLPVRAHTNRSAVHATSLYAI